MPFPTHGRPGDEVLAELAERRAADLPLRGGKTWAYFYDSGLAEADALAAAAYADFLPINALDPTAFPSYVGLENEVVGAVAALLGAGPDAAGTFTSGGTESIMLAVKAARDSRRDVAAPRIVVPGTAHPAFHKAAHYLGVDVEVVPVDPATFRAEPGAIAEAIDDRTVLVVASAVSYPHGVLDPVGEIAGAAARAGVLCHVDACVGGLLLPFLRRLGEPLEPFDLGVEGVTSISADLHKYGYAPKGASVVVFADAELRRASYFASASWPGYTVVNSGVQSTRSAGPVAAAWALLQHLGEPGYLELASRSRAALVALAEGVAGIPGLRVLGDPVATLIAIAAEDDLDVFVVADELKERGTFAQVQLSHGSSPANLHLSTFGSSPAHVEALLDALRASVAATRVAPPVDVPANLSEILASLDPAEVTGEAFAGLLAAAEIDLGGELGRLALINRLLDAAPPALRETLLEHFLGALFTPRGARAPVPAPRAAVS